MNLLYDDVPTALHIAGKDYPINSDFRTWIKFEVMLLHNNGESRQLLSDIMELIFPHKIPASAYQEEATEKILWFYRCGQEKIGESSGGSSQVYFDYEYDAGYIYAAFLEQFGIDINTAQLHWWKFRAMFLSLSDSTEFVKIMSYRGIKITSKMSSEQKNFLTKMKKAHKIPLPKSEQEKQNALENALIAGKPIDELL